MKHTILLAVVALTLTSQVQAQTTQLPRWDEIKPLLNCAGIATLFSFEEQQRLRAAAAKVSDAAGWHRNDLYYQFGWFDGATTQIIASPKQAENTYFKSGCHLLGREPAANFE